MQKNAHSGHTVREFANARVNQLEEEACFLMSQCFFLVPSKVWPRITEAAYVRVHLQAYVCVCVSVTRSHDRKITLFVQGSCGRLRNYCE